MQQARVETRATWNDADLVSGTRASEKKLQSFGERAERGFSKIFARSPHRRAELAVSRFVSDLASGNVAGAVTALGTRMTGLGLAIGVAIGTGVELFAKLNEQIKQATEAEGKLRAETGKSLSLQSGLGPEGITQQIELVEKATEDFQKKSKTFGRGARNFLEDAGAGFMFGRNAFGASGSKDQAEIHKGEERSAKLATARADAELKALNVRKLGLTVSEKQGDEAKIELDYEKSISKLFLDRALNKNRRSAVDLFKSAAALAGERDLALGSSADKRGDKSRSLASERELADMALQGASAQSQKIKALENELSLIQSKLALTKQLTAEERAQLQVQETKAKANLQDAQLEQFLKPQSQRNKEKRDQDKREQDLKRFQRDGGLLNVHRDMSGNVIGGTDPMTGKRVERKAKDQWGDLFPGAEGRPGGKSWTVDMIQKGRANEQMVYGTVPALQDLRNGAQNTGAIANFGQGPATDKTAEGKETSVMTPGQMMTAAGVEVAKGMERAFRTVMKEFWSD